MTPAKLERYLYGDCILLALWLHRLTGWPLIQWFDRSGDPPGEWVTRHALVRMPDGALLDAGGPHRPDGAGECSEHPGDECSGGWADGYLDEPFSPADWELGTPEPEWAVWGHGDVAADARELLAGLAKAGRGPSEPASGVGPRDGR
jgi:hypothetical protein